MGQIITVGSRTLLKRGGIRLPGRESGGGAAASVRRVFGNSAGTTVYGNSGGTTIFGNYIPITNLFGNSGGTTLYSNSSGTNLYSST